MPSEIHLAVWHTRLHSGLFLVPVFSCGNNTFFDPQSLLGEVHTLSLNRFLQVSTSPSGLPWGSGHPFLWHSSGPGAQAGDVRMAAEGAAGGRRLILMPLGGQSSQGIRADFYTQNTVLIVANRPPLRETCLWSVGAPLTEFLNKIPISWVKFWSQAKNECYWISAVPTIRGERVPKSRDPRDYWGLSLLRASLVQRHRISWGIHQEYLRCESSLAWVWPGWKRVGPGALSSEADGVTFIPPQASIPAWHRAAHPQVWTQTPSFFPSHPPPWLSSAQRFG